MKRRFLITVIIAAAISIGVVAAYYSYQSYLESTRIPSDQELPDKVILDNQRNVNEVQIFLSKYPNATVFVDRSGRLAVDYTVSHQASEDAYDTRSLNLRVFSSSDGKPQEMYLNCGSVSVSSGQPNRTPDGKWMYLISKDIVNYIETEKCWSAPFSRQ